jgi:hypothetical protein
MIEYLLFKSVSEIENNIVSIGFDCKSKEINVEFYSGACEILEGQSEFSTHDKDLDGL